MKKAAIGILLLLLLTGCWDRLQLRRLHLIDFAGLDRDENSGNVVLNYVVTKLESAGQGAGKPVSEMTELKGPSLVEAVGQGEYNDQGPFLAIHTGFFLMSKSFISHDPIRELNFLLHAPYTTINTPVVVLEGNISKLLKANVNTKKQFSKKLYYFVDSLESSGTMRTVSMMQFILSREDPLADIAVPLLKPSGSGMEFGGAVLFRQGMYTGAELNKDQVGVTLMMLGKAKSKFKFTGNLSKDGKGGQASGNSHETDYGFSVKKGNSKITVQPKASGSPKVKIEVGLKINVFELGDAGHMFKADYVNRMEKEISRHLEERAAATIGILQKANSDILGIGKQIKAHHPDIWKSLDWREDYPRLSIEPKFDVQILNSDEK